jgi:Tol biopolymer transport system component
MAQPNHSLIPRKALFGNPDKTGARLSPDGQQISYLAPVDGVLNLWLAPLHDLTAARPLTHDRGPGIRWHFWAFTNQQILFGQDKNGDENWRLYSLDLLSGQQRDLTPFDGVQAKLLRSSSQRPHEIAISLNHRQAQIHDPYLLNLTSGALSLLEVNEAGFIHYLCDE